MTVVHTGKGQGCRPRIARKSVCRRGLHLISVVERGVDSDESFARFRGLLGHGLPLVLVFLASTAQGQIDLPTSKQLAEPVPGSPQRLNSLPMTAAISPDGRYLAVVNAGYGTFESRVSAIDRGGRHPHRQSDRFPRTENGHGSAANPLFRAGLRQGRHASLRGHSIRSALQ